MCPFTRIPFWVPFLPTAKLASILSIEAHDILLLVPTRESCVGKEMVLSSRCPLLQEPFILKVLENNRVLRGKTRFYEKHTHVWVLYGFCTGFVWLLYGLLKVKPGFRLENPVFDKQQA